MTAAHATIAAICALAVALITAGTLIARTVRGWAAEVATLRKEFTAGVAKLEAGLSELRLEMERARTADRLEARKLIKDHAGECQNWSPIHYAAQRKP